MWKKENLKKYLNVFCLWKEKNDYKMTIFQEKENSWTLAKFAS